MKYYRAKTPLPDYNLVRDSKYPAVVAEKGVGALKALFSTGVSARDPTPATIITAMAASASASAIPQTATASLTGGDVTEIAARLTNAKAAFIQQYESQGGKFSIDILPQADRVDVKLTG